MIPGSLLSALSTQQSFQTSFASSACLPAQVLPKDQRVAAAQAKQRAAAVQSRLTAVSNSLRQLHAFAGGKVPAKLAKTLDHLDKVKVCSHVLCSCHGCVQWPPRSALTPLAFVALTLQTLDQLVSEQAAARDGPAAKQAAKPKPAPKPASTAGKGAAAAEEKARLKVGTHVIES